MNTDNVERYLNSFGKQVVNRAKGNLQKAKGGGTALEGTIRFEVVQTGTLSAPEFTVQFYMSAYGKYIDKGVSGTKVKQKYKDYLGKVIASPYKYTTKQPPPDILAKWIKKKGLKGRDEKTGRFISHKSLAFIIGRKIKRDGIKSLAFFQKPLGLGMKQYSAGLAEALAKDIIDNLTPTN